MNIYNYFLNHKTENMKHLLIIILGFFALTINAQDSVSYEIIRKTGKVSHIQKVEISVGETTTKIVNVADTTAARLTLKKWEKEAEDALTEIEQTLSQDTLFVTNLKQVLAQRNVAVVDLLSRKKRAEKELQKLKAILRKNL
jgi:hypothetical protein